MPIYCCNHTGHKYAMWQNAVLLLTWWYTEQQLGFTGKTDNALDRDLQYLPS